MTITTIHYNSRLLIIRLLDCVFRIRLSANALHNCLFQTPKTPQSIQSKCTSLELKSMFSLNQKLNKFVENLQMSVSLWVSTIFMRD